MKTLPRATPCGDTIFCDDIRQEITGKVSLIGVYAGALFLNKPFPTKLPKLAMRIMYQERPNESDEPVSVHIYVPGKKEPLLTAQVPKDFRAGPHPHFDATDPSNEDEPETILTMMLNAELHDVPLECPGAIRVRAVRGDERIRLGSLTIMPTPTNAEGVVDFSALVKPLPA